MLRALLAAGIAPDRAVSALNNELPPDELARPRHALTELRDQTAEALVGNAPSTVTSRLERMQRQGWIERTVNPNAKGSWRIELTVAGRRVVAAGHGQNRSAVTGRRAQSGWYVTGCGTQGLHVSG
jgi:hypothetical protein